MNVFTIMDPPYWWRPQGQLAEATPRAHDATRADRLGRLTTRDRATDER